MNRLLSGERSKWILIIGLVGIGAAFITRNVISYPTKCLPDKSVEVSQLIRFFV